MPGVDKVAVSLTHEQALVENDTAVARPDQVLQTLRDIGYTIFDPRKLRAFEEVERDLAREARRFRPRGRSQRCLDTGHCRSSGRMDRLSAGTKGLDVSGQELLAIAAAAEAFSEHPLARAVIKAAFERGATPPDVESFEAFPGKGVVVRVEASEVLVGSPRFLADRNADLTHLRKPIEAWKRTGAP